MAPNKKVHVFVFISILLCIGPAAALEIAFRLTPQASIPFGGDQKELYSSAPPALQRGLHIRWLDRPPDLKPGGSSPASTPRPPFPSSSASGRPYGFRLSVFPRIRSSRRFRRNLQWFCDGETYGDFWYRAWGEAGFRFSPSMSVSAAAGWSTYLFNASVNETGGPMYSGLSAGLSLRYLLDTRSSTGGVDALLHQDEPVFPLVYSVYRDSSLGSVRITNQETAEIRNVRVSFRAGDYTACTVFCGSIPVLAKRRAATSPLRPISPKPFSNSPKTEKLPRKWSFPTRFGRTAGIRAPRGRGDL